MDLKITDILVRGTFSHNLDHLILPIVPENLPLNYGYVIMTIQAYAAHEALVFQEILLLANTTMHITWALVTLELYSILTYFYLEELQMR
jgi:hypothetical protein